MRIGIITGEYPPMQGGVGAYTQILARNLLELGHHVNIIAPEGSIENTHNISLDAVVTSWNLLTLFKIRQWASRNALDVVCLQFETAAYNMSAWIHFLPHLLGKIPLIVTFHDLLVPYLFPKAGQIRHWIMRHLARSTDAIIMTNQEDLMTLGDINTRTLIPIGSNIETNLPDGYDREAWRNKAGVATDDFLIAFFGFMNRTKGVEILLEDVAIIRDYYNYPIKIIMIGGRTGDSDPSNIQYAQDIDHLIEKYALTDHIHWTGYVDEKQVSAYLTASDAVALPFRDGASYRRGSLMAAIHHSTAIITTEPNVYIPLFVNGENMLLAPMQVLDENCPPYIHISQEILRLYRDRELREHLRKGAKALSTHFEWRNIAENHISFFNHVLGEKI